MKSIHLWGVKQNNLKDIEVKIPLGSLTVVCGPSGSGKSSLAFETLYAEGQRRYIESMSNYARQFLNKAPKPDIEGIANIPPAISIEQRNSVRSSRSTVGTTTELIDYLRLLFEKIGKAYCPTHKIKTQKQSITEGVDQILSTFSGDRGYLLVEIPEENRILEGKKLHSLFLQDGYLRVFVPKKLAPQAKKKSVKSKGLIEPETLLGEISDLAKAGATKTGIPTGRFFLVVDRLSFDPEDRGRIHDSLTQAYEASIKFLKTGTTRKAWVVNTDGKLLKLSEEEVCPICGYQPPLIQSQLFSFNSPVGACPTCKGFGNILDLDEKKVVPNSDLSIQQGALNPFTMPSAAEDKKTLFKFCKKNKIPLDKPWKDLAKDQKDLIWKGNKEFFGVKGLFEYLDQIKYKMHVRVFISRYRSPFQCTDCKGHRLRQEALSVLINEYSIKDLSVMTIEDLQKTFNKLELTPSQGEASREVLKQIKARLDFLLRVGVHYLTLNRETRTLSGGEFQRIMLANQLGMGLSQSLYVLDEPTVGLHPRDNDRLISILKDLKNLGNTLVIVEHDHDVIKNAENIIEMGPGSGHLGGEIMYSGSEKDFYKYQKSNTVRYLIPSKNWVPNRTPRPIDIEKYKYKITLRGCEGNNLKNVDVAFPLNRLVTVTGVSGSGKSTLVSHTLYPALAKALNVEHIPPQKFQAIEGVEHIKGVLLIDQSSIGKSARSSPVTYLKVFDAIRTLMATTPDAQLRGYTAGTFSLNVDGGRCPACKGLGSEEIDMMFMDNVVIPCDVCDGKRYRSEILEIMYKGKNISQILGMTVNEAMQFFIAHPNIRKPLSVLKEVGLDYLKLGQPAASLSGGECQRLKIAKELSQTQQKATLYILDEPTTGLHFREVELLMAVLNKLIEGGGSVLLVEHNLDVIRGSDYLIDLGPEAGTKGGQLVAQGDPESVMKVKKSLTGQYLKKYIEYKHASAT